MVGGAFSGCGERYVLGLFGVFFNVRIFILKDKFTAPFLSSTLWSGWGGRHR